MIFVSLAHNDDILVGTILSLYVDDWGRIPFYTIEFETQQERDDYCCWLDEIGEELYVFN
jgi:hypothetical protein